MFPARVDGAEVEAFVVVLAEIVVQAKIVVTVATIESEEAVGVIAVKAMKAVGIGDMAALEGTRAVIEVEAEVEGGISVGIEVEAIVGMIVVEKEAIMEMVIEDVLLPAVAVLLSGETLKVPILTNIILIWKLLQEQVLSKKKKMTT